MPRMVRAAVVASASVALSVMAHVGAGGHAPSWGVAGAALVVLAGVVHPFTARRLTLVPLLVVLGVAQVFTHFAWSFADSLVAPVVGGHVHGHDHGAAGLAGSMVLAHVVGVVVTALLVTAAEAKWHVARAWLPCFAALLRPVVERQHTCCRVVVVPFAVCWRRLVVAFSVSRRGPPLIDE